MSKKTSKQPRLREVEVRGELRAEPDWDRFAWALLQHARLINRLADDDQPAPRPTESTR